MTVPVGAGPVPVGVTEATIVTGVDELCAAGGLTEMIEVLVPSVVNFLFLFVAFGVSDEEMATPLIEDVRLLVESR